MARIKLTKSELKVQRDALKQFRRFLPTLQLKKQQLQMEMLNCQERLHRNEAAEREVKENLSSWIALFGHNGVEEHLSGMLVLDGIERGWQNIAGVQGPIFKNARFSVSKYDFFNEDAWIDDALEAVKKIIALRAEHTIIEEQYRLIGQELRVTTQRVNLFEKVKIPQSRENIRVIQIYLGDQQTAAVGRSKIAKRKSQGVAA